MSVRTAIRWLVLLVGAGCGPEATEPGDWMIGVFSSQAEGVGTYQDSVERYYFYEDKSFRYALIDSCGGTPSVQEDLTWTAEGETTVRVSLPDTWTSDALIIERLRGCDAFQVITERQGTRGLPHPLYRGEICSFLDQCPDGEDGTVECGCRRTYCGEPPAPLDCDEE